jgi:hypothetical protein
MHSVNLDLLRTGPHHANGQPKDPHAHHRAELLALQRATRRQRWLDRIARLRARFSRPSAPAPQAAERLS